jgi:hypothetical protein
MKKKILPLMGALLVVVTACAGGGTGTVRETTPTRFGYVDEFTYAAANRDMLIEVYGTPAGVTQADADRLAIQAFQQNYNYLGVKFTKTPGKNWDRPYKVVVVYGAPALGVARSFCRASAAKPPATPLTETSPTLGIAVAFCYDDLLKELHGEMKAPASSGDPTLANLLNLLAWRLFPVLGDDPQERMRFLDSSVVVPRPAS